MLTSVVRISMYVISFALMIAFPFMAIRRTRGEGPWTLEQIGVLLTCYALPFYTFYSASQIGGPSFITVAKILLLTTLALWFIKAFFLTRDLDLFVKPFQSWTSIFVLLGTWSLGLSLLQMRPEQADVGVRLFLMSSIPVTLMYVLMLNAVVRKAVIRWCLIAIVTGTTFACVGGAYELVSGRPICKVRWAKEAGGQGITSVYKSETGRRRITSFNLDPDLHSQAVCFGLGPLLSFAVLARRRRNQIVLLALAALFCANVVGTGSKGGWIGLATVLVTFAWLMRIRRKALLITTALLLLAATVAFMETFTKAAIAERILGKSGKTSNRARFVDWKVSLIAFSEHPILGNGLGSSLYALPRLHKYAPDAIPMVEKAASGTHIAVYTLVLTEVGLVGLIVYLAPYFFTFRELLRLRKRGRDPFFRHMAYGLFASLLSNLVMLLFHPIGGSEIQLIYMAMTVNAAAKYLMHSQEPEPVAPGPQPTWRLLPT